MRLPLVHQVLKPTSSISWSVPHVQWQTVTCHIRHEDHHCLIPLPYTSTHTLQFKAATACPYACRCTACAHRTSHILPLGTCDAGHVVMPRNAQQHASQGRHQQAPQNSKHITGFVHQFTYPALQSCTGQAHASAKEQCFC
jgi:hypothetical protein